MLINIIQISINYNVKPRRTQRTQRIEAWAAMVCIGSAIFGNRIY